MTGLEKSARLSHVVYAVAGSMSKILDTMCESDYDV